MGRQETVEVTVSITVRAWEMLQAFTAARNDSIHNQADSVIKTGISALVEEAPLSFKGRYITAIAEIQEATHDRD